VHPLEAPQRLLSEFFAITSFEVYKPQTFVNLFGVSMRFQPIRVAYTVLTTCFISITSQAIAHDYTVGGLHIVHPYAVPSAVAAQNGAAYIRAITNKGDAADQLLSASSPAAQTVEIHTMKMDGDVMRMREINVLPLPAKAEVTLRHDDRGANGYHLMLMKLANPLNVGDRFPLTLKFEKAGTVEVVQPRGDKGTASDSSAHKH
jgi:periplasmic copper chaperone A